MKRFRLVLFIALLCLLAFEGSPGRSAVLTPDSPAAKRSSSAMALTGDGMTLLAVNPDSNSLSVVDTASQALLAEIAVGGDPRSVAVDEAGQQAYVANRGSDSLSVVDLVTLQETAEVQVGSQPYGVMLSPDGSRIYLTEQGSDSLRILEAGTLATLEQLSVADRPSGLALSEDGDRLYVTHLLTGQVTLLYLDPYKSFLPIIHQNEAALQSPLPQRPLTSASSTPFILARTISLWPDSNLLQSIVISPDEGYAYLPHTRSNTANQALTFDTTVFPLVSIFDLSTQEHLTGQQIDLGTLDPPGVGLPFDAAVSPDGSRLWVVNAASNDVSVIDLAQRTLAAHIEVGDNPRGIQLSPDGSLAYVNNTLAGTVSIIDTGAFAITGVITTTTLPLPPCLLTGKRLFHSSDDPRMSRAQWISCNTCHFEGEGDGRTWTFAFAGPRNTTSLLGMVETYPLRWSGEWNESADAEFANRRENFGSGLIDGEMNCSLSPPDCVNQPPNQGRSYELDCLAAFMDSLAAPLSPAHAHGEPLTEAELRGQALFLEPALGCITCHPPPLYTDLLPHDVGTATVDERIGPAYDTPSLRGLFSSAPYFHDGSAVTLQDAVTRPSPGGEHDLSGLLSEAQIADLVSFLLALPYSH